MLKNYIVLHANLGGEGRRTANDELHEVCVLEKFGSKNYSCDNNGAIFLSLSLSHPSPFIPSLLHCFPSAASGNLLRSSPHPLCKGRAPLAPTQTPEL